MSNQKLTTESYKGVRDFYPEDYFVQNYIFSIWSKVVESFGYVRYDASILEPSELYKAKTGSEIVNEQTYTFIDRGEREVTLRPEMTPTVARLVAQKERELTFPLRWYSIPNLFRYEKPQRGRLREHWQLNVDLFGIDSNDADTEIINVAYKIMHEFGAQDSDFVVKVNNRKLMNDLYSKFSLDADSSYKVSKVIDKKNKISSEDFVNALKDIMPLGAEQFASLLDSDEKLLEYIGESNENVKEIVGLVEKLTSVGIKNVVFDPTLMRGFDYYTGIVFEVFDLHPNNNRSVFGGGRYDDLLDIFGSRKVPTVGFGAGDVTARDFLEAHNLLPQYKPNTDLYIATVSSELISNAVQIADSLRAEDLNVVVDITNKKLGDQIKTADKQKVPFVLVVGEDEVKSDIYPLKNMETGQEVKVKLEEIKNIARKS